MPAVSERPHGYTEYKSHGCRCYTCAWAASQYGIKRTRAIAYGTWQPYIDAEPVRRHIRELEAAGLGLSQIARLAGQPRTILITMLYGNPTLGIAPFQKVRQAAADALLAVQATVENLADGAAVANVGTARRLRALAAAGWPRGHLAARLGMSADGVSKASRHPRVRVATMRAVTALYDELLDEDPQSHGISQYASTWARNRAAANGWAPPGCWDDDTLDDPDASPEWTGACGTESGYRIHQRDGIPSCAPCRAANTENKRRNRCPATSST